MNKNRDDIHLIHHSNKGVQYASTKYIAILKEYDIRISMTENGDPKENPQAERINSTIKNEILMGCEFHCIKEVVVAVTNAVNFYNNERPHMSIGMMTPVEASLCCGVKDMKWTSYRELAIKKLLENKIAENGLPLDPVRGLLPGYALQSTPDRDKTWAVNQKQS